MKRKDSMQADSLMPIRIILLLILVIAVSTRCYYAVDFPLSGDEVGVGVVQATGHALDYSQKLPAGNFPVSEAQKFINYEKGHGIREVLRSLRHGGMHPPFYYIVLHYLIKFAGNDAYLLRSVSILFSVLSVYIMFCLGRTIISTEVGLYAAFFMAISPYCIHHGVMVRPYPLLMLLGLLSTLQVYSLVEKRAFSIKNIGCLLYMVISIIGIYTMYHYVFIIISQCIFVLLSQPKNIKTVSNTLFLYLLIFIAYIPWLPSLKSQLEVVNAGKYYFHDKSRSLDIISFINKTIQRNFIRDPRQIFPQLQNTILQLSITVIVSLVFLAGAAKSFILARSRIFTLSVVFYLIVSVAGDKMMHSNTLVWEKFQFYLIPVLFLIFAHGVSILPKRFFVRYISFACIGFLLIMTSYSTVKAQVSFDGPYAMKYFRKFISTAAASRNNYKTLLILNTYQRRYLFPLIHGLDKSIDIAIVRNKKQINTELNHINNVRNYNEIFICDFLVNRGPNTRFSGNEAMTIVNYLLRNNFSNIRQLIDYPGGALLSFTPAGRSRADLLMRD